MSAGGALDASVTLDEVFTVLCAKRVPLAPELAGYLVLEIAEHADPIGGDVDPKSVFVGEEGTVALVKPRRPGATGDAEASVRSVLARLLDASGSQTPALAAASKRRSGAGLPALADELQTALIPVNRAAGRRALARLAREVRRVTLGVGRNASPSSSDILGGPRRTQPSLPPPVSSNAPSVPPAAEEWEQSPTSPFEPALRLSSSSLGDVDALIEQFGVSEPTDHQHARALQAMAGVDASPAAPPAKVRPSAPDPVQPQIGRNGATRPSGLPLSASRRPPASKPHVEVKHGPGFVPLVALLAIGGGAYATWQLRPATAGRARREPPASPLMAAPAALKPQLSCSGVLIVGGIPPRAEVLLRVGQAPVDVDKMPVGARLEFVATAEGYAPKRVVIPAGAPWDTGPDGKPRFETAVQLDKLTTKPSPDVWPPGEPGSEVGGEGSPGTVHVVATPRAAEVWMLAGLGPETRVDQLRCDRDVDLLVAGPATFRKRVHVPAAEFRGESAEDDAGLPPDPRGKPLTRTARVNLK